MHYLAVLGRQPKLSLAELESLFQDIRPLSSELALFSADQAPNINLLGGILKIATPLQVDLKEYLLSLPEGKITLGFSDYTKNASARQVKQLALKYKKMLHNQRSIRIIENKSPILSTATSHHNQLGEKPKHIEVIIYKNQFFISLGTQNITAYTKRDQARPARDAKVGMLPPKLAQILINLCGPLPQNSVLLDPFCGTGVLLQEAILHGFRPYGTDLEPRMIEYTTKNLQFLSQNLPTFSSLRADLDPSSNSAKLVFPTPKLEAGDAVTHRWIPSPDAIACETYLGPPMSSPPADIKLKNVKQQCGAIISDFLKNLHSQIKSGTPVVLAIPAWLRPDNTYSRLNLLDNLDKNTYNVVEYKNLRQSDLLYYRPGQIVAREIIVLRKI